MIEAATLPAPTRDWFGQPRGFTILFLTEMWEKFSYYGMRALLVYYMTKQLMLGQQQASLVYGIYTAMVYFTPIIGGVVADRWLGRRRAVIIGATVMAVGHFLMTSEAMFYVALAAIAIGNGLFLPSLPSQVNDLYTPRDPRRGSAYNLYYMGINIGGVSAALVCGTLGEMYGWHYGFGAAGIGMLIGLGIYLYGQRYLPNGDAPSRDARDAAAIANADALQAGGVHATAAQTQSTDFRQTFYVLLGIGLSVTVFRSAYEQMGNTIALWADTGIDRQLTAGFSIPMTWFQSLNPLLVLLLTPLLVAHWIRQARHGREPSPARKMACGAFGVALAYVVLATVIAVAQGAVVSWLWLGLFVLLLTGAELFILPVGLGLFARLAPSGHGATTIAAWFFAAFGGNLLGGALGAGWTTLGPSRFFLMMAAVSLVAGVALWLLDRPARRVDAAHAAALIAAHGDTRNSTSSTSNTTSNTPSTTRSSDFSA